MIATREIPAGKILVGEYGDPDVKANMAECKLLAEGLSIRIRHNVQMVAWTPGFRRAGSRALWQNGSIGVTWIDNSGAIQGRQHSTLEAAQAHFDKLMLKHDAEVTPTFHGDEHCASCFCGWFMKGGATAMATMAADHNAMAE